MADNFFDEQSEQSLIKAEIISKYFWAWAKVIIGAQKRYPDRSEGKIAYIDLFAGPGRYRGGAKTTPVLVIEQAIREPDFRRAGAPKPWQILGELAAYSSRRVRRGFASS